MRSQFRTALAVASLALPAPLAAQGGFWASAGLGTGMQQVACEICRGEGNGGWSAKLAAGGTLSARVRLGGEFHGWTDKTEDIRFTFYSVTPAIYWYPSGSTPYYLMAGAGLANYTASNANEEISTSSVGLTVGMGLELPLVGRWRLNPFASYTGTVLANLKVNRTIIADAQLSLFQLGLGLTRR
jgi:opacity protein-like surface antigen